MKRAKIVIGLQVAFLVGILAFSGVLVYHSKDRPTPVTTLKAQLGLQVDTDPAAYERFKDKRELVARLATMVWNLQQGKTPEGIHSLGKVGGKDAFGVTLEDINFVILPDGQITELKGIVAAVELADAHVGILKGDFSKLSSAGVREIPVPAVEPKAGVTLTPAEAMKAISELQSKAAVAIAPPAPGQIPQLFAMLTSRLGEELGPRLIAPAEAKTWEEALGLLRFRLAAYKAGEEVSAVEPVTVKTTLGEFWAQFAERVAVAGYERVVTTITYLGGTYVTEEVREFAAKEKISYDLKVILPGIVGREFIKTPFVYITNPVVVRPLNVPVIVSIQRHITKEGGVYLVPEAEKLALVSEVEKALLEAPVEVSIEVLVRPGQPFVIPAGVGYSIKNPTLQPAFLEHLVSTEQIYISGPYQRFGEAHYIKTAEGMKAITIEANPAYETELPKPAWATPTNTRAAGLETEGPSLYTILAGRGLEAGKLAAFLRQYKFQPSEAAEGYLPEIYEGGGGISFLAERGKPAVQETSLAVTEQILGLPVSIKAASAGMALVQIEPARITLLNLQGEELGKADTAERWGVEVLQKLEDLHLKGALLAEEPKTPEIARAHIERLIKELTPPTEEKQFVQALSGGREAVFVRLSAEEFIVIEQPAGTYQPGMAEKEITDIMEKVKAERGAFLIDFNTLGVEGTRKDGSKVFVPSDFVMKLIAILNNLKEAKMEDGITPRYLVAVYSDNVSEQNMKNLLGALAVPFDSFVQASTVTEAIGQIAEKEKIKQERFIVNIAQSTIERNPKVLDGFAKLAEAVNLVMVKTPKPGEYVSYKTTLLNSLKLLEGILTPQQITDLKVEIENAPTLRGLTVQPEEDKDEAVSRMQAAVSV